MEAYSDRALGMGPAAGELRGPDAFPKRCLASVPSTMRARGACLCRSRRWKASVRLFRRHYCYQIGTSHTWESSAWLDDVLHGDGASTRSFKDAGIRSPHRVRLPRAPLRAFGIYGSPFAFDRHIAEF